jgi:PAS domain S-box-containing protein
MGIEQVLYDSLEEEFGIISFDQNLCITHCNKTAAGLLGLSLQKIMHVSLVEPSLPSVLSARSEAFYQEVISGKASSDHVMPEASTKALRLDFLPIKNTDAFGKGGMIMLRESTDSAVSLDNSNASSQADLLRYFIDQSPVFYAIADAEGMVYFTNEIYYRMTPLKRDKFKSFKSMREYIPDHLLNIYLDSIRKVAESGESISTEEPGIRLDGSAGHYLVQKFPIQYQQKTVVGIIATDITELKQQEAQIRNLKESLEKLIKLSAQLHSRSGAADLEKHMYQLLEALCQISGAKEALMFRKDPEHKKHRMVSGYHQEADWMQLNTIYTGLEMAFPWMQPWLDAGKVLLANTLDELPGEAQTDRQRLKSFKIDSLLLLPIRLDDAQIGYFFFTNLNVPQEQRDETLKILEIAAYMLGHFFRDQENVLKLEKSQREYQLLARNITDIVAIHDIDARCLYVSPSVKKLLGYSHEEAINTNGKENVHPDDALLFRNRFQQLLSGDTVSLRHRRKHKDGHYLWVETSAKIVREQGKPFILTVTRDINQQKQAEDQLVQREEYLSSLLRSQTNYLIRTDIEGNFTFTNQRFREKFNFTDALIGSSYSSTIHSDDIDACMQMANFCLSHPHQVYRLVLRKPKKEGGYYWTDWEFIGIPDASGNVNEIQGVGTDITDKKEALSRIEKSEAFIKSLVYNTNDAIWVVDADYRLIFANPAFKHYMKEFMGITLEVGMRTIDSLPDNLKQTWINHYERTKREGHFTMLQPWHYKGNDYYFDVSFNPVVDDQGNNLGYSVFAHNTTEQKLTELELVHAKRSLEEALRARGTFLSMITHELKTPLNAISGMSNLLQNSKVNTTQRKYIETLTYSTKMLSSLINDILDYASMQAGEFKMEQIDFNLYKILEQTVSIYRSKAQDKNLRLQYQQDEQLPRYIKGDPIRLGQILNNLLDNAFKFTEKGKVRLQLNRGTINGSQACLVIRVSDTGMGIPEEKLSEIFEPFRQASADINRTYGGRGLGLAIVKNLVEHSGGSISVQSIPAMGTTFDVRLPYEDTTSEGLLADENLLFEKSVLNNLRVLYVEDVSVNQTLMRSIFDNWGVHLEIVSDGYQCLDIISKETYDIILMDLLMPRIDGFETALKIRQSQQEYNKNVPIIAVTAFQGKELEKRIAKAGINGYITKPIDFQHLYDLLLKYTPLPNQNPKKQQLTEQEEDNYLQRLEKFAFKDKNQYAGFLKNLKEEFSKSREQLQQAVTAGDNEQISAVRHHNVALLSMFSGEHEKLLSLLSQLKVQKSNDRAAVGLMKEISGYFLRLEETIDQKLHSLQMEG